MEGLVTPSEIDANISKALGGDAPAPAANPAKKAPAAAKPKPPTVGKKLAPAPAAKPPIEGLAAPADQLQKPQPGSPCQVAGCFGRYSILQTVKKPPLRVRYLICRTCQHQPAEPHTSQL